MCVVTTVSRLNSRLRQSNSLCEFGGPLEKSEQEIALTVTGRAIDLRHEGCFGPNCLEEGVDSSFEPSCQSLVELEDSFVPIPMPF